MEAPEDRKTSGSLTEEMFLLCNNRGTKSNRKGIQYSAEVTCTELHGTDSMKLIVTELPVALASTEILGSESQRIRSQRYTFKCFWVLEGTFPFLQNPKVQ
jgi:hypothetical protein